MFSNKVEMALLLIDADAKVYETDSDFPTDNECVDELLRRHVIKPDGGVPGILGGLLRLHSNRRTPRTQGIIAIVR